MFDLKVEAVNTHRDRPLVSSKMAIGLTSSKMLTVVVCEMSRKGKLLGAELVIEIPDKITPCSILQSLFYKSGTLST